MAKKSSPSKRKDKAATKGRGRPSTFDPAYCDQAFKLCLMGATDKQLADFFNTSEVTLNKWKKDYPEFLKSLKLGKMPADAQVAQSLFRRANGFKHRETKFFVVSQGGLLGSEIQEKQTIKVYPPDTIAAIFWLKNRQPELWRDKIEQDVTSKGEQITQPISDKQFEKLINLLNAPDK